MGRLLTPFWWALLVAGAAVLWWAHGARKGGGAGEGPPANEVFAGRFALGASRALGPQGSARLLDGISKLPPEARLRMVPVVAEVRGEAKARAALEGLRDVAGGRDFDHFWRIYGEEAPPEPDAGFVRRNGWFARLALSRGLPDGHPLRRELLAQANRTFVGSTLAVLGAIGALVAGLVLLPIGITALARGRLRLAYRPPPRAPSDRAWLETVTLLLVGVTVAMALAHAGPWAMWALLLVPLWPLARGVGRAEWRAGLGLARGRGILREVGAGLVGYLAGMPVYAAGLAATLLLSRALGEAPSHPAIEEAAGGDAWARANLLLAACVWAPLVEEAVFRGAFLRYLRPRVPRVLAAALVGLLFAAVHPQGIAAIPALMAIGGWFAMLREWRGTLVPCITAHATHNLALVSLAILTLGT